MSKKTLKIVISAAAVVLVAGISAAVFMKLRNTDAPAYRKQVLAKDTFELNGVTLSYSEPDDREKLFDSDRIIYRGDDGLYYYFDSESQYLRHIRNKASDDEGTETFAPDTETLFKDAKERIGKWYDGDIEKLEWECTTYDSERIWFNANQVLNDDVSVWLASVLYYEDGSFRHADFNFDAMLDTDKIGDFIPKEEAVEKAKDYILKEYGYKGWQEINVECDTDYGMVYWEVELKDGEIIPWDYFVGVDLLTGEICKVDSTR